MSEASELSARLAALEFIISTVLADALACQPDIGHALQAFQRVCLGRAEALKNHAASLGEPEGLPVLASAAALVDRTNEIVGLAVTLAGAGEHACQ